MRRSRGDYGDEADQAVHQHLYDAIAAQDSAAAAAITRSHLTSLKERLR
jgi:DNA-binding FadR family transcriptional regulator